MQNATLSSSFFEESRIKALSLQKEGETALLLWLRLFFTAVREDSDGRLMLYGAVAHDERSISAVYGLPVAVAKMALELLIKFDLLVYCTEVLHLMVKSSVAQNKTNRDTIQLDILQKACKVA